LAGSEGGTGEEQADDHAGGEHYGDTPIALLDRDKYIVRNLSIFFNASSPVFSHRVHRVHREIISNHYFCSVATLNIMLMIIQILMG